MNKLLKHGAWLLPVVAPFVLAGCVSQADYNALQTENQQLKQQVAHEQSHVGRLQEAVRYTVNSDLLFPSGGWQISADGKDTIAKLAKKLAAGQQDKLMITGYTDNAPIGAALRKQGITSNEQLSQKRAEMVMQYMVSQGVNPSLVAAQGMGAGNPVAANSSAQGRAQNRRVEVTVAGHEPIAAPLPAPMDLPEKPNPCPLTSGGCG